MHILLVLTNEFQTKASPIGGVFQLDQAKVLRSAGYKVGVISPALLSPRRFLLNYKYKKKEIIQKIPVLREYKKNLLPAKIKFFNNFFINYYETKGLSLFDEYKKKFGTPDILHVFDIRFGLFVGNIIKEKRNVPFILTEYCAEVASNTLPLTQNFIKNKVKNKIVNAHKITTCSKKFSSIFKKKLNIKKNVGVHYPVMPPSSSKTSIKIIKNKKFTFISVNRLDPNKNVELIINAFSNNFKGKEAVLELVGKGPNLKIIKKLIKKKKIKDQVFIYENLSRNEMLSKLSRANCCLVASKVETFGVILIEAAARGLSLISTKAEGPLEIVNKTNGFLVEQGSVKKYGQAMIKTIDLNLSIKKRKLIRNDIINRFGNKIYLKRIRNILNKI